MKPEEYAQLMSKNQFNATFKHTSTAYFQNGPKIRSLFDTAFFDLAVLILNKLLIICL